MAENKKYPEGYKPKIEYWEKKIVELVLADDQADLEIAKQKLEYFNGKEWLSLTLDLRGMIGEDEADSVIARIVGRKSKPIDNVKSLRVIVAELV